MRKKIVNSDAGFAFLLVSFMTFSLCFKSPLPLFADPVISRINIRGNFPIFQKELRRAIDIRIGEEYKYETVKDIINKLKKIYHDEGYNQVSIMHELEKTDPELAVLTFIIQKGPKTRIRKISFVDDRPQAKPDLRFLLGLQEGQVFKRKNFQARLKSMEVYLVGLGYLRADVRYLETLKDEGAFLDIFVYRGPKINVKVEGNQYFISEKIRNTITFYENRFFDSLEAEESIDRIKELYQDNGFLDVQVRAEWTDPDILGDREVVFTIQEGKRTFLKKVIFEHKGFIKTKKLKRQFLSLSTFSIFRRRPFKAITFEKDLEALKALYQSEGFPNVKITTKTERKGRKIKKRVIIDEDVRIWVKKVIFEGNKSFSERVLRGQLEVLEGRPFRPKAFQDDKRQLAIFYGNHGHPYVRILTKVEKDDEKGLAMITYKIDEGAPVKFGRLDIRRNIKTQEKVIHSATTFKEGEYFSYQKIFDTQERLSRLGLFRSLTVEPKGMDKMIEEVDTQIEVEEMETGRLNIGAGFSSRVGYRGYMEVREDNLWGRAISGSFRADLTGLGGRSQIVEEVGRSSKYTITFRDPLLIPRHKIEGEGSIYTSTEDRREYHSRSNGLEFGIWRPYKRRLRIGLVYHIDLNRLDDITIDPNDIPESYAEHTISAIGPTIIYDSRDNFLDPRKGIYANVNMDWAGDWIGGDQNFYKTQAEFRVFLPLSDKLVAALSIRGGYIRVYGQTETVPIQERFFAGGANTIRGFKEDSLGPTDKRTGLPLGGRRLWINNLELRYPLYKSLKGVIFYDTGTVWTTRKDFEETGKLREGAGVGIRWITPIGPVRLDYARAVDRKPDESEDRFYLSIGHAF